MLRVGYYRASLKEAEVLSLSSAIPDRANVIKFIYHLKRLNRF